MRGRGHAMIGNGVGQGANFVQDAVDRAIHSPLIEQVDIKSAAGLLANIRVNPNFPISKWEEVCNAVQSYADEEADCKFGMIFDESIAEDQVSVTILITGISASDNNLATKHRAQQQFTESSVKRPQESSGFFGEVSRNNSYQAPAAAASAPAQDPFRQNQQGYGFSANQDQNFTSPREPAEVPVDSFAKSPAEDKDGDLWTLPPILRSKSE